MTSSGDHRTRVPTLRTLLFALHAMFYGLLVVGLIGADGAGWGLGVALGAVYAVGMLRIGGGKGGTGDSAGSAARRSRTGALVWLATVAALWTALVVVAPTSAYLAFPLYFLVLHLLPRGWSLAAVAAITGVVVATQATTSGGLTPAKVIGPCAGAAVAVLTAYAYVSMYREGRRRQQLIDELVRAQDELARTQREAGRLAERQRLAREIHDTLAQGLSSIVLLARGVEGTVGEPAAAQVREIRDTASANLAEARRFVAALTPPALDGAPLGDALRRVAAGHARVTFRMDGEPYPLPIEAEVALLRLTQEALANVERHAAAEQAAVTLAYLDDQVTLDVFDDGAGFVVDEVGSDGGTDGDGAAVDAGRPRFGLHGMRERIAELGGQLTIESAPGEGTAIAASLPVQRDGGGASRSADDADSETGADDRGPGTATEPFTTSARPAA